LRICAVNPQRVQRIRRVPSSEFVSTTIEFRVNGS